MIEGMLDIFGTRLTLAFAAIALLYLLWSTAPIWWSMQRVFRRDDIKQRGTFVFTVVALSYGATILLGVLLVALLGLPSLVLQPAHLAWSWVTVPGTWLLLCLPSAKFWLVALSHLTLTWWITHTLAAHWQMLRARMLPASRGLT
ncbi:hypothetical protein [Stenotrophomonas sp.]|uniref:hypothetical protein n=1 Tax=Stenotrophomonas sp. TaxID=69392 RepID=UPI0028AC7695|nr:hypothetical protein [Stenotrophomonas sp.]